MKNACLMFAILFAATAFAADGKTVSYKSGDETILRFDLHASRQRAISGADRHPRVLGIK